MANQMLSDILKKARLGKGLSQKQVYEALGIKQSRFSAWENGKAEPDIRTFLELCHMYGIDDIYRCFCTPGISYDEIRSDVGFNLAVTKLREVYKNDEMFGNVMNCLDYEYAKAVSRHKTVSFPGRRIPVYTQPAAAGLGNYISDDDMEYMELPAPADTDAGIRISGDSMEPDICDGEIVYIKFTPVLEYGQIGIFVYNGDAYCKKLDQIDGRPCLASLNPKYFPIFINENDNLRTVGRVLL